MINLISSTRRGKRFEIAINSVLFGCEKGGCVRSEHSKTWLKYQMSWAINATARQELQEWWEKDRITVHREDAEYYFEDIVRSASTSGRNDIKAILNVLEKLRADHALITNFRLILEKTPAPSVEWVKSSVTNSSVEFL